MLLETLSQPLKKALATNSTATSFASKVDTLTEPTGDGVHAAGILAGVSQNAVVVYPFAVASANDTFSMRVIGWHKVLLSTGVAQWVPVVLAELACTVGAATGVAGGAEVATELYADTITIVGTTANAGVDIDVVSPANDTKASATIDLKGAQKFEFTFDNTRSGTSFNTLFRQI